jgi:ABC-type spermidine/putrescine transport system permease subunit II
LFDLASFVRVVAFGIIYAGIEYRYVNRYEKDWPKTFEGVAEKPVFWVITPYHLFLLLPLFIVVSFSFSISAWAGNAFLLAVLEDIVYFAWRGRAVSKEDWTTTLFGSFRIGGAVIPVWWPLDIIVAGALYLAPL